MMAERGLGRRPASDNSHLQKYPLTAATIPAKPMGVVVGWNWHRSMDDPVADKDGNYWIRTLSGGIRGGHCVCLRPPSVPDLPSNWAFIDQGVEGACVGAGWASERSLSERRRFDLFAIYEHAKRVDEWQGEAYDGTSVRAGGRVCHEHGGPYLARKKEPRQVEALGISAYRWAASVEDIARVLAKDEAEAQAILTRGWIDVLNSWGTDYPNPMARSRNTRFPLELVERLTFGEDGDAC
ncbi:MAG: hypothetical protein M3Q74_04620, partial [Pseudomonadota bacterium]|nr:hypothetical protein [Pseudomonadota bacterium]